MPAILARQAVSHGHSKSRLALHFGCRHEQNDWRIFADFASVIITRAHGLYASDPFGEELANERVRLGLHHHRPVPVIVPLGAVPPEQGRRENASNLHLTNHSNPYWGA